MATKAKNCWSLHCGSSTLPAWFVSQFRAMAWGDSGFWIARALEGSTRTLESPENGIGTSPSISSSICVVREVGIQLGELDGAMVGEPVGNQLGKFVGVVLGTSLGDTLGMRPFDCSLEGTAEGQVEGPPEGSLEGEVDGYLDSCRFVGDKLGNVGALGFAVVGIGNAQRKPHLTLGCCEGTLVGTKLGPMLGT